MLYNFLPFIQAVPVSVDSFESRKKLPLPWCGVRDNDLSSLVILDTVHCE
jgi:uncharacterized UPF0160 family protein